MANKPANFAALPDEYSNLAGSKIVVIPIAYGGTVTWIKGTEKGPKAIIDASANLELYDIETNSEVYRAGIFTDNVIDGQSNPENVVKTSTDKVQKYLEKGKYVIVIGGEHTVALGSIKAHAEKHENVTVVQLDAHCDLRDEYNGSKYNHACIIARAKEICPIVQVGIRSMDSCEKQLIDDNSIFYAKDIYNKKDWIEKAISRLSGNVYLTIDLDVFDPSLMPSTGTPEPGGLFWYDLLDFLRQVFHEKNVIGFDVVELCPDPGNKAPDFLAAKLIYKLLSYKFGSEYGKERFTK